MIHTVLYQLTQTENMFRRDTEVKPTKFFVYKAVTSIESIFINHIDTTMISAIWIVERSFSTFDAFLTKVIQYQEIER
jgi:hypothetical protein